MARMLPSGGGGVVPGGLGESGVGVMFTNKAKTVAEYIDALPGDRQPTVRKLRSLVKKHLPDGYKEGMNFGAITYAVPLTTLPDTYNGQPLCYAAIAAQKNYYSLYLMNVYGDPTKKQWMAGEFRKHGKKLDMGKSCLRFKSLDELPLDVVGEVIASTPMEAYVEQYRLVRRSLGGGGNKTARGR